ncbi:MAG: bifunctional proline dehydrogenase/L-glutamate gamma-semialdehyde dehydrogenase [Verrucomicrobia bacterium]|nr:bifunctional proline dehydrogenase/L-glutamate gamma-semialdehyde dehydrogenase [Verrucomicrobiota bacterium]
MEQAQPPALFSKSGFYGTLMGWALKNPQFKTRLFRFVDALPTLTSGDEVSRHLHEYLDNDEVELPTLVRATLRAASAAGGLLGGGIRANVIGMARQFMLGKEDREIITPLRQLHRQGIAFTADALGETVLSETEADQYAAQCLRLLDLLARETAAWPGPCPSNISPHGVLPQINVSIKISALDSQIHPADPDTAIQKLSNRLRPILRRAKDCGAFINFDMEQYALKNLTVRLFKTIFAEPEFAEAPGCGLALQAYLLDTEADLRDLIQWARDHRRRIAVRLVKGAYWDYETIIASQRGWPTPVFTRKAETDANFEKLSLLLLENDDAVAAAFGTHNVRSIAHALAQADRLGVDRRSFEIQMLHGMADPLKAAVLQLGVRLREYCPVGELLPGMAYLVRRLLENTSNEGFLASKFARNASRDELLRDPKTITESTGVLSPEALHRGMTAAPQILPFTARSPKAGETREPSEFRNEPPTDFTVSAERENIRAAIQKLRAQLGQRHPLVINNKPVNTSDWTPSLNPANQSEIIGYAAKATVANAEAAVVAARAAQPAWAHTSAKDRAALLDRTADLMRRDKAALVALEILEAGKSWVEADADVAEAIDYCRFYAAEMRALDRPAHTQSVAGETNLQHWWPRGVGVIIGPWNFPLAILTGMTSAAVVAGNAVVMKPSDQTPIIAARLMSLFVEAGLPPGVVNLLTGSGSLLGAHLVAHPQANLVAFTGSMEVGLRIWETAGRTRPGQTGLKKVICEMGGKNALIVDSDADLDEAVAGVLVSAFGYSGQKCSALSRLIVVADNYDRFLARLLSAASSLRIGPAEQPGSVIVPVISRDAQQRILARIEAGGTEATLAWQGFVPSDANACYVPPSIFTNVPPGSHLFRDEIFGPVLAVARAKSFDHAIALANDCQYALTGGVYSRSPVNIERARRELVCGNLYINRPITGALVGRQPFGGFGMSGGGTKAGGREYLQNFLLPRVITENTLRRGFAPNED